MKSPGTEFVLDRLLPGDIGCSVLHCCEDEEQQDERQEIKAVVRDAVKPDSGEQANSNSAE
ncbi:MAG: hypothetical protein ACOH13_07950 [Flavobacteriales bacterium]